MRSIINAIRARLRIKRLAFTYGERLRLGRGVAITRNTIINIAHGCKISIGDNVKLNSENYSYHVNMFAPTKLYADRDGEIVIGDNCRIHGSCIHAYKKISIGSNCLIAANCQIIDGNGHDMSMSDVDNRINTFGSAKEVIIEDSVWIGSGCTILPGVKIGKGSVIRAGSIVVDNIPEMVLAGGNPAIVLKEFN